MIPFLERFAVLPQEKRKVRKKLNNILNAQNAQAASSVEITGGTR